MVVVRFKVCEEDEKKIAQNIEIAPRMKLWNDYLEGCAHCHYREKRNRTKILLTSTTPMWEDLHGSRVARNAVASGYRQGVFEILHFNYNLR